MASLIPGYEYDIFISYRQKDNKGDHWVTEFVEALKTELESTFKEDISVYFDENPHDGLLETHEVEDSLEQKLKSLIFIPIISQTYCDPKSFAWEHEFRKFVGMASSDRFGIKVRLPGGNVSSRVLPVRIYELKKEDILLCEEVLGSVLRGVEFIYRSHGVNRPLREIEDHAGENLNKTYYRDQINKLAQSIRDIIDALTLNSSNTLRIDDEKPEDTERKAYEKKPEVNLKTGKFLKTKIWFLVISITLLTTLTIIFGKQLFKTNQSEEILKKAITTVDPFNSWHDYYGKIRLRNIRMNAEEEYNEIIEIWTKNNNYKRTFIFDSLKSVSGINNGNLFRYDIINKDTVNRLNLSDTDFVATTKFFKSHHFCQFGLLMELEKSGLILDRKLKKEVYQGSRCLVLKFTPGEREVSEDYFKGLSCTVYIDASNYSIRGYKLDNHNLNINWDVTFTGNIRANGLNIPLCKIYYNSSDNSFIQMDVITPEN